jgi:ankyrin repeat protein
MPKQTERQGRAGTSHLCSRGRAKVVRLLLDDEANIEAMDEGSSTALKLATRRGHVEVVKLLQKKRVDIKTSLSMTQCSRAVFALHFISCHHPFVSLCGVPSTISLLHSRTLSSISLILISFQFYEWSKRGVHPLLRQPTKRITALSR